jgi:cephalosporin-C deacetylase
MSNLFAEGSSQGGAFSYAAAALSDYPFTAIAPCVAFLGDFPDYFDIVSWPGSTARENQGSMTDEEMYAFLSYFDTKNLATRINAAVMACSGLQDGTCPPHTNLAPFNNLPTQDKVMYYYPEMKHEIPSDWSGKYYKFFKERIK